MHLNVLRGSPKPKVTWPLTSPPGESEEERRDRLEREAAAKKRSEEIDKEIQAEKEMKKKNPIGAKILLLGQAESGKSTVLKNFQLQFAPKAFEAEAEIWKPIIHLNLVRSVNFLVNFLNSRLAGMEESMKDTTVPHGFHLSKAVRKALVSLAPLRGVEETLRQVLASSSPPSRGAAPAANGSNRYYNTPDNPMVPAGQAWKRLFTGRSSSESAVSTYGNPQLGQVRRILAACGEDIAKVWASRAVRNALRAADINLQEQPGFFLDEVVRITQEDYKPISDDILKSRMSTVGPEAHHIFDERDSERKEWVIIDVGGHRSQRAAWAQFFDDVNIIIFLAPMSAFNQTLAEDENINRLTDSFKLWQKLCSNKILADLEFVLFLNKLDILQTKLKAGIQFSEFVSSYDKPNETSPVAKYLVEVFGALSIKHSPRKRKVYTHLTTAVDMWATAKILVRVRDLILVNFLAETNVL